jgi:catechol 2,3-dioxygenase-like lactoylglutathione lyase family enzyme
MKIHHIGIITKDIVGSGELYQKLGYITCGEIIADAVQNNKLLFLKNDVSGEVVELIEPMGETSTVFNAPEGYHHFCYEVDDVERGIAAFNALKIGKIFTGKISAPAFSGRTICFAYLKNNTIIEFLESEKSEGI